jgi:agmatinase
MPATGTPEPGGPPWYPTLKLLRRVFEEKNVVGVDVVELAPMGGNSAPDFVVAKLVYKMIAYHSLATRRG